MSKSYDLSTSSKWANLVDGEHTVTIKSKASNYGTSNFSNSVTVTKGSAMPVKGDLITLDNKQYRVLKVNGSVAEVLAMYDASTAIAFDSSSPSYNNTYAGKSLDTYCNSTFYSGLSVSMKSAIVDKTFTQDEWTSSSSAPTSSYYTGTRTSSVVYYLVLANATFGTSITRHCYVLSVQDVLDYLDVTTTMNVSDTTLTNENIWKMFWNQITSPGSTFPWLRSAYSAYSYTAFMVSGTRGNLDSSLVDNSGNAYPVRPAFQIDLSKIEWTPVGVTEGYTLSYTSTAVGVCTCQY